jgi:hypothetical protein
MALGEGRGGAQPARPSEGQPARPSGANAGFLPATEVQKLLGFATRSSI